MKSKLVFHHINSSSLEREFEFALLYPVNHDRENCNLLFVNDGYDYLDLGRLRHQLEGMPDNQQTRKLHFVLLPPGDSTQRWNYYHIDGCRQADYTTFIYHELLPFIKQLYQQRKMHVIKKGLLGDSLAAASSLRTALIKPEEWSHVLLQSAAFSEQDVQQVDKVTRELPWSVYQSVGTREDAFVSAITNQQLFIYTRNLAVKQSLAPKVQHLFYHEEEEDHLWEYWRRNLPAALNPFIQHN